MKSAVETLRYSFLEEYNMTHEQFINEIAKYVQKYAPQFNIKCYSAVIAQAICESKYGTSNKVYKDGEWRHNYFGLKWRDHRCAVSNDYFSEWTAEQDHVTKQYHNIESRFCKFKSLEDCVLGYFQWTNISNYANLKGVTDPFVYLTNIKADKYATSVNYVQTCMNFIEKENLTRFDPVPPKKYYRVQVGAYSQEGNAQSMQQRLKQAGFDCIIKKYDNLYKCQCGAFLNKANAEALMEDVKRKGFNAFVTYC